MEEVIEEKLKKQKEDVVNYLLYLLSILYFII